MTTPARIRIPAMNGSPIHVGGSTLSGLIAVGLLAATAGIVVLAGRRRRDDGGYADGFADAWNGEVPLSGPVGVVR